MNWKVKVKQMFFWSWRESEEECNWQRESVLTWVGKCKKEKMWRELMTDQWKVKDNKSKVPLLQIKLPRQCHSRYVPFCIWKWFWSVHTYGAVRCASPNVLRERFSVIASVEKKLKHKQPLKSTLLILKLVHKPTYQRWKINYLYVICTVFWQLCSSKTIYRCISWQWGFQLFSYLWRHQ